MNVPSPSLGSETGIGAIHWSPRLGREKIRRLYLLDAQGIVDEELIDEVGATLAGRCRDILTIRQARYGRKVLCPICDRRGEATLIHRQGDLMEQICCPRCGWQVCWRDYLKTVKRRQLNAGGAVSVFEEYLVRFKKASTPQEKMFAIDQLIHEFHFSFQELPDQPTRPVGVNFIRGNLSEVIEFLNELTYSRQSGKPDQLNVKDAWEYNLRKFEQIDWKKVMADRNERKKAQERSDLD
jgi:hypothetical protein